MSAGMTCTYRQQPLAHRGLPKGRFPPTRYRGAESEGASVLCNRTEEAAGVSRLDLISGTRPIKLKKRKKKEGKIGIKSEGVEIMKRVRTTQD